MCPTNISVWFVCKLCQGAFRQVDDFIEHKKEEHFPDFQKTTCIVFEESEKEMLCPVPVIIKTENQLTDENVEPPIKIEVTDVSAILPFSSEIIDEPEFGLVERVEPKSELITYESEINPEAENNYESIIPFSSETINEQNLASSEPKSEPTNFEGEEAPDSESHLNLKQPERNPYVLLKRLTSDEIQKACFPKQVSTLVKYEQKNFTIDSETCNSWDGDSCINDPLEVEESPKMEPTPAFKNNSMEQDPQLQCQLCSKQLESDAELKIHVGNCSLYHEDRNRYCVLCNKKLSRPRHLKAHCLRYHETEEDRSLLYKFKCNLCHKKYQRAIELKYHLQSHKEAKQQLSKSLSALKPFKCSEPNCGKEFKRKSELRRHAATHLGLRPFSCWSCNKTFTQSCHLQAHLRIHTGERPYKCKVDNCSKAFTTSVQRLNHHRNIHRNILLDRT